MLEIMKRLFVKTAIRKAAITLSCLSMFALSACTTQFLVGDAISTIATKKTIGDHAMSLLSNKDCSTVRVEQGRTYCKEDDPNLIADQKMHCYNELGKVTCYKEADTTSVRSGIEDKKEPVSLYR